MPRPVCRVLSAIGCACLAWAGPIAAVPQGPPAQAAPALAADWPAAKLEGVLLARDAWRPVPPIDDREGWARVVPGLRARLVERGERALKDPVPALPATLFLDYTRTGNRGRFESAMFARRDRLHALVMAECVEDTGRFLDAIVDTAWAITEESSWTVPAHQGAQKAPNGLPDTAEPIVDLFSAQTAHSLAWTWYLLGSRLDNVSPLVRPRIAREIERRVLAPYEAREDWGWMGFAKRAGRPNNWNPWINSNVLAATLFIEPGAARRARLTHKVLRSLDAFLGPHPADGGCDEGPSYWGRAGASLFENLELLQSASGGRMDYFANPVVADIGRYIYRVRVADTWFVPVGDSGARVGVDRGLVFRYGRAIGDPALAALGSSGAAEGAFGLDDRSIGRTLLSVVGAEALLAGRGAPAPLPRDAWFPSDDMQLMAARDREGSSEGFFVAAWGSHNAQSHNHNDVGNAIVFVDGTPVLVDAGRPTYTAQTFSSKRYDIWAMQSAFHNLPTVNGQMQKDGRAFAAKNVVYQARESAASLMLGIAPAYPEAAGIREWTRIATLERGRQVVLSDAFVLKAPSRDLSMNLMTPCEVSEPEPGTLRMACGRIGGKPDLVVFARFDARAQQARVERIDLDDRALTPSWGDHLNRIVLTPREAVQQGTWKVTIAK
jgi:hypothetical protein